MPGNVQTPRQMKWYTAEGEAEIVAAQCLDGRIQPADVAALVLFLASDDARMCTGSRLFRRRRLALTMAASSPQLVCRVGAILGEGPVWVGRERALWFVDIKGKRLHRFDPVTAVLKSWNAPAQPGWILPEQGGGFVVGSQRGIDWFDPADGRFLRRCRGRARSPRQPPERRHDRSRKVGSGSGRWTMTSRRRPVVLYRYDASGTRDSGLPPVTITNGPAISPDGRTLYHTDTLGRTIHAVEMHDDGTLGTMRPFVRIEEGAGYPDGPVVDSAGCVWTGLYGGWGVRRYAPDGALIESVRLPTANVTKIAFGGPDLRTAFATTARKGLDAAALAQQPEAGDLFAFEVDVPGLPITEVADFISKR